jgi:hypothetical protein
MMVEDAGICCGTYKIIFIKYECLVSLDEVCLMESDYGTEITAPHFLRNLQIE